MPGTLEAPFTLALILAAMAPVRAQTIRGILLDARTGRALEAGLVVVLSQEGTRLTEAESAGDGTFALEVERPGTYDLYAERLGYYAGVSRLEIAAGDTVALEFRLEPAALTLDSLTVRGEPAPSGLDRIGFTARRQGGIGYFLTRDELEERGNPRNITDALRTFPGVSTDQERFGPDRVLLRKVGTPRDPRPHCRPYLFLDGLPVQPPWEELVDLDDVAALEVYPEAGRVPASFSSRGQTCGVVVVWTRLRYGSG